jgi:hypothetical protein
MEDKSRSKFKFKSKSKKKKKKSQGSPVASLLRLCVGIKAKAVGVHQDLVLQQEITEQGRDQRQSMEKPSMEEKEEEEEKRRTSPNKDRVGSQRKENGIPMNFEPPIITINWL